MNQTAQEGQDAIFQCTMKTLDGDFTSGVLIQYVPVNGTADPWQCVLFQCVCRGSCRSGISIQSQRDPSELLIEYRVEITIPSVVPADSGAVVSCLLLNNNVTQWRGDAALTVDTVLTASTTPTASDTLLTANATPTASDTLLTASATPTASDTLLTASATPTASDTLLTSSATPTASGSDDQGTGQGTGQGSDPMLQYIAVAPVTVLILIIGGVIIVTTILYKRRVATLKRVHENQLGKLLLFLSINEPEWGLTHKIEELL